MSCPHSNCPLNNPAGCNYSDPSECDLAKILSDPALLGFKEECYCIANWVRGCNQDLSGQAMDKSETASYKPEIARSPETWAPLYDRFTYKDVWRHIGTEEMYAIWTVDPAEPEYRKTNGTAPRVSVCKSGLSTP